MDLPISQPIQILPAKSLPLPADYIHPKESPLPSMGDHYESVQGLHGLIDSLKVQLDFAYEKLRNIRSKQIEVSTSEEEFQDLSREINILRGSLLEARQKAIQIQTAPPLFLIANNPSDKSENSTDESEMHQNQARSAPPCEYSDRESSSEIDDISDDRQPLTPSCDPRDYKKRLNQLRQSLSNIASMPHIYPIKGSYVHFLSAKRQACKAWTSTESMIYPGNPEMVVKPILPRCRSNMPQSYMDRAEISPRIGSNLDAIEARKTVSAATTPRMMMNNEEEILPTRIHMQREILTKMGKMEIKLIDDFAVSNLKEEQTIRPARSGSAVDAPKEGSRVKVSGSLSVDGSKIRAKSSGSGISRRGAVEVEGDPDKDNPLRKSFGGLASAPSTTSKGERSPLHDRRSVIAMLTASGKGFDTRTPGPLLTKEDDASSIANRVKIVRCQNFFRCVMARRMSKKLLMDFLKQPEASLSDERRNTQKRMRKIHEIITTEISFVKSLNIVINKYMKPFQSDPEISRVCGDEVQTIFAGIESIESLNSALLRDLQVSFFRTTVSIGRIFLKMLPFMKMYSAYINNYSKALSSLVKCQLNKPFADFLLALECDKKELRIHDYLIMPIQRAPRYVLLFQDLLKYTSESHIDYANLEELLGELQKITMVINESRRNAEQTERLMKLQASLDTLEIMRPSRKLLAEGKIKKNVHKNSEVEERYMYLFNDVVLCAFGPVPSKIDFFISLFNTNLLEPDLSQNTFELEHKLGNIMLTKDSTVVLNSEITSDYHHLTSA
eukprot:TRINITY_DN4838_c0_g1_i2.p1 TRINITY_DN4838_c0_g1~~TRINITY_DN4838_c0_g1_i2.p1  ORF type:complete len:783 (+),score=159.09 TRINITY_DN4838_c0_g1_i2:304-2652(+)